MVNTGTAELVYAQTSAWQADHFIYAASDTTGKLSNFVEVTISI